MLVQFLIPGYLIKVSEVKHESREFQGAIKRCGEKTEKGGVRYWFLKNTLLTLEMNELIEDFTAKLSLWIRKAEEIQLKEENVVKEQVLWWYDGEELTDTQISLEKDQEQEQEQDEEDVLNESFHEEGSSELNNFFFKYFS